MLDILRANTRSVLTYVLFGIIIIVFVVSFGPGSRGCTGGDLGGSGYAARVNGKAISIAEYQQVYTQLYQMYQQEYQKHQAKQGGQKDGSSGAFTPELAAMLGVPKQAMEQIVTRELVVSEASRHGIVITDDDISRAVLEIPSFQRDGQFQMDLYTQWATNTYGSRAKFEERLRRDLTFQNMMAVVRQGVHVSDDEVKEAWLEENDRVNLTFVRFPIVAAKAEVKLSDADLQAFVTAKGQQIEQFYKDHASRYEKKKQVRARHILAKVAKDSAATVVETARKKIEALAERVKKGEDFAKLARENSDDPGSKENGGDLGFFGAGARVKPFEDAAFGAQPGQVLGPVRTDFGWHLIRVEEVQNPETIPLDKAKNDIARELLVEERAKAIVQQRAQEALAKVQAGQKLAEETGLFARNGDFIPILGPVPNLVADAFTSDSGKVLPKIYDTRTGPTVAVVKEHQRPDPAKFAEKKAEFTDQLRSRREAEVEAAWLKSLREKAKIKINEAVARGEITQPQVDLD